MMNDSDLSAIKGRPVIFGEVLFDTFPDGREVLGGAPFNVARHLQGFGCEPLFISRIGDDERGARVQSAMQEWGMDMSALQVDPERPTGIVKIAMQGKSHTFDILPEQAYDYIDTEQTLSQLRDEELAMLYFGSLIERSPVSHQTLEQLRQLSLPSFVDINLRDPWWNRDGVSRLIRGIEWLKLNDDELQQLAEGDTLEASAQRMREQYGFELLIVTCGANGAMFVDRQGVEWGEPVPVENLVDTVGAGDAFSAVSILGLLKGWPQGKTLRHALSFASRLCEVRGAVLPDKSWYQKALSGWA